MSKRLTIEHARKIAKENGGECVSTSYKNNWSKLTWKCSKGHKWKSPLTNITHNSNWCPECAGNKKKNLDFCKNIAKKNSGSCLSKKYVNSCGKLVWKCDRGHVWLAIANNVFRGKWCPKCGHEVTAKSRRKSIVDMHELARSHEGKCVSTVFHGVNTHLEWECSAGHRWMAQPANVKSGHWCPYCSNFKSENICRKYLEYLFNEKFIKVKPSWLRNPRTNSRLELDGYCEKLKIAFEHQGEQHYTQGKFFSKTKESLDKVKYLDKIKRKACKEKGIVLIEIPSLGHRTKIENLENFIFKQLSKYGISP